MNNSKTCVICDSGSDISSDLTEKYDIRVVPLIINYRERSFTDLELEKLEPHYVYNHFKEEIPKTSALNMQEVLDVVEKARADGYENFIGITISSAMSSTFNAVRSALIEYSEENPTAKTYSFDSKNISIGSGVFAIWAASELNDGKSFEEVTEGLERKKYDIHLAFYMDTLEYLKKGGRITPSVAIVGKLLNLRPIIACNKEGVYYTVAKLRGSAKAVEKLVSTVIPEGTDLTHSWIMIMNGKGAEYAERAKKLILDLFPGAKIIMEKQIVPTMAINTGPGLLGIARFDLK